ncbi:hypothetical protein CRV160 [Nile crocodilepox virus]|uniref:Uncharacterized protein n=1 Tax=Nile crocodilepox virus (isolate Crocodylus niloticus/Zimbabwe/Ume/2001) TaxID=1289473 RepID=Q06ZZ1_CPRVZ|nr:hypothetical protein CRV160 [Nile crocodilepox virus]ABJ09051.1 hypothetical protein CRV160 [Nile crocodilepox virus]
MWSKACSPDRGPVLTTAAAATTLRRAAAKAAVSFCAKGRSLFASIARLPKISEDREEDASPARRNSTEWSRVCERADRCSASARVTIRLETWGTGEVILDARAIEPVARHLARWLLSRASRQMSARAPACSGINLAVFVDIVIDRVDSPLPSAAGDERAFDCWALPRAPRSCPEVRFKSVLVTRCRHETVCSRASDLPIVENKASNIGNVLDPDTPAVDADGGANESDGVGESRWRGRSIARIVFFYGVR